MFVVEGAVDTSNPDQPVYFKSFALDDRLLLFPVEREFQNRKVIKLIKE